MAITHRVMAQAPTSQPQKTGQPFTHRAPDDPKSHGPEHTHPPAGGAPGLVTKPMPPAPKPTVVLKPGEVPAIKFDNRIFDFGRVRAGLEVKHDFWFTNTGTGPLEITSVKPG